MKGAQNDLNIENTTEAEAEILIKNSRNKRISFETLHDISPLNEEEMNLYQISFNPQYTKLGPLEKISVKVILNTADPATIDDYLIIDTKHSESQYISVFAEVQKPYLYLTHSIIDLGVTYVGLNYKIDEEHKYALLLKNKGNLDAKFEVK